MLPVKQTMVSEELANLDVRAYERGEFASAFLGSNAGALLVLDDYMRQMANGELAHGDGKLAGSRLRLAGRPVGRGRGAAPVGKGRRQRPKGRRLPAARQRAGRRARVSRR